MAMFLITHPRILTLVIGFIIVAGMLSAWLMPRLEDPVLRRRVAVVSTVWPGATPAQMEASVTVPIEQELRKIPRVKQLRSNTQASSSNVVIELADEVNDVDPVWEKIQQAIDRVTPGLPEGSESPELDVFPLKAYASIIALTSDRDSKVSLLTLGRLADELKASILNLQGTEAVDKFGEPKEELLVSVRPLTLAATGLTTGAISEQVKQSIQRVAGGTLNSEQSNLLVETKTVTSPKQQLRNTRISFHPRQPSIALGEIADIEQVARKPVGTMALINGTPAVVLGVMVDNEQQVDDWSVELDLALAEFRKKYSQDIAIEFLFSQSEHVAHRMSQLGNNLMFSALAVTIVILVLMGWRSMLVVVSALPLSALMVLAFMHGLSIPIHQMSVTGLIVALGLLIDNAIVMVEEVRQRMTVGDSPLVAISDSIRHLKLPLLGSTLTTILAFLPIATMGGPSGEFVGTIAISVILAIVSSFALSMTVIPALIGLLRQSGRQPSENGRWNQGLVIPPLTQLYLTTLRFSFRVPILGVLLGLILPLSGFWTANQLQKQFFPPSDRRQIQIEVERSASRSIQDVKNTVEQIRQLVNSDARIGSQNWFLGESAPTFYYNVVPRRRNTPFYAQAFVDVKSGHTIGQIVRDLQTKIDQQILDSRVIVRQLEQGPPFDAPIELRITGPDLTTLRELGNDIRQLLTNSPYVTHTRSDLSDVVPKLTVNLDDVVIRKVGLSGLDVSRFVYSVTEGVEAGHLFDGNRNLPVRVAVDSTSGKHMRQLNGLSIPYPTPAVAVGSTGKQEMLSQQSALLGSLAAFKLEADSGAIIRIDGQRVNEIKAYIPSGTLPSTVTEDFQKRLGESGFALPDGYRLKLGGEAEQRDRAVTRLIGNAVLLFSLIAVTLVSIFRSFRSAIIVAFVGGLTIGLGPLSLYLFGFPFGFMAIVGTMGLVGVAINDSIVVLAALRDSDGSLTDANVFANCVGKCTRHILATTFTTIAGFLPLVVAGGEFWPPLAITIAGGVGGATILALYFVPSIYVLLYRFGNAAK